MSVGESSAPVCELPPTRRGTAAVDGQGDPALDVIRYDKPNGTLSSRVEPDVGDTITTWQPSTDADRLRATTKAANNQQAAAFIPSNAQKA